ncbi:hypothetical protein CFN78_28175 [Amycolatopsis antarctica]|uniref:Transcriptional regulator WhiB n=1 Tax=Amycolatopsis antarctica TaxID=1854586 RepID=A0A263CUV0_9PSEU|nr:WhiB family transcriptional regulator [Amycolatopsis antarctica]OZM69903.1 hypothetical protein CFN78_28175 [Amycolatopsis antarctica]
MSGWRDRAACQTGALLQVSTTSATGAAEVFFPFPSERELTLRAKRVCQGCPVRTDCLPEALDNGYDHGVWGGLDERERRELRRADRGAA